MAGREGKSPQPCAKPMQHGFKDTLHCCIVAQEYILGTLPVIERLMRFIGFGTMTLLLTAAAYAALAIGDSSYPGAIRLANAATMAGALPTAGAEAGDNPSTLASQRPSVAGSPSNAQMRAAVETAQATAKEADKKAAQARARQVSAQKAAARAREAAQKAEANVAGYGVLTGTGTSNSKPTWRYAGQVRARKENGFGVETWSSGERNEGEFLDDAENGSLVSVYAGGTRYEGDFKNAQRSGAGVYIWTDGDRYEGEFSDGNRNGLGIYYGGDTKEFTAKSGHWALDRLTGYAVIVWKDGTSSVGSFKDDLLNGYGARFDARGVLIEQGLYEAGELKDGAGTMKPPLSPQDQ